MLTPREIKKQVKKESFVGIRFNFSIFNVAIDCFHVLEVLVGGGHEDFEGGFEFVGIEIDFVGEVDV